MTRIISLHYATVPSHGQHKRIAWLDLAKGFTVFFIPAIHVIMLYANTNVRESSFSIPFRFIAEWPGAQLLMFVMGMSFSFSKKNTMQQLKRALIFFLGGYLLNLLKFLLLYWCGWLPKTMVAELLFIHSIAHAVNLFLIGDILQFAGLALFIMSVLKTCRYYPVFAVFIGVLVIIGSPLAWDWHHNNLLADHLLHLIGGSTPDCFFPLMPWMAYPLIGLAIGNYLQWPYSSIKAIFFSGAFLLVSGYAMHFLPYHFPDTLFWRTYPDKTIMHLGFVMVWASMWFWIDNADKRRWLRQGFATIKNMFCFCSRNITAIYLVQWVVIFWMLPLWGYHNLDTGETVIATSFVYVVVFGIVILFRKMLK